jgi:hypothetical protein
MAYVAPNNLIGEHTVNVDLSTTSDTSLLSNAASSGRVFKILSIVAANVDGTNAADISVSRYSAAALGGTAFPMALAISVPANASLIVSDATTPVVLAANTSLGATAGASDTITMTVTYQEFVG